MATHNLRRQQRDLLELADQLEAQLDAVKLMADARTPFAALNAMTGLLRVHLATDAGVVYPRLKNHDDASVRVMALRHLQDSDALKDAFFAFVSRWKSAEAIQRNPIAFIREARDTLHALRRRLTRKEHELYPLVDNLTRKRAS